MPDAVVATGIAKQINSGSTQLTILRELDLRIGRGETVAILGPSGAGKTTLLSLLAGLDLPSQGRIELDGAEITAMDEEARAAVRAGRIGFVFQSFQLLGGFTAEENVLLSAELAGVANPQAVARACLDEVGLEQRRDHLPSQLSGGEQQRVALARAFAGDPKILFADEPTGNLDTETGAHIIDLMFRLNRERGTTLILVTHDQPLAGRCSRALRIAGGSLLPESKS